MLNAKVPFQVTKVKYYCVHNSTGTCQKPLAKSNLIKYLAPARDLMTSLINGNGYLMGTVKSLVSRRSTQKLSASPLPSLGTTTTELYYSSSLRSTTPRVNILSTVSSMNSYLVAPHLHKAWQTGLQSSTVRSILNYMFLLQPNSSYLLIMQLASI